MSNFLDAQLRSVNLKQLESPQFGVSGSKTESAWVRGRLRHMYGSEVRNLVSESDSSDGYHVHSQLTTKTIVLQIRRRLWRYSLSIRTRFCSISQPWTKHGSNIPETKHESKQLVCNPHQLHLKRRKTQWRIWSQLNELFKDIVRIKLTRFVKKNVPYPQ